jgi:uncharacterized protein (TIGR00159 family)
MSLESLLEPLTQIRVADVVDIALVSALVYATIALLRRTQAAFVAIGVLLMAVLYIVANLLDLRLTVWIFQGFFAVFLVILVVIFQEELRQLFERVAVWSLRQSGSRVVPESSTLDVVAKCAADFAAARLGALIVLPGAQPVDRHVHGGIELDGKLSEPLLKSIFDHHSPGHDGAVIIERGRLKRFAVHLPLSTEYQKLRLVGTRHTAALGLAELCDALCVVVSEERGQISVAWNGTLRLLANPMELPGILQQFLTKEQPAIDRRAWSKGLRENWTEKVATVAVVAGLWYLFVPAGRPATFTYEVPVTLTNLPPEAVVESMEPTQVRVTVTGIRRTFYLFNPQSLDVAIDASLAEIGRRTFDIPDSAVNLPNNLVLQHIEPRRVKISLGPVPP